MLKACHYCGRIHKADYTCGKKPIRKKYQTKQNNFRNTWAWQKKRKEIKERDHYLCRICLEQKIVTYEDIEVHHIVPLEEDMKKALEDEWLISLCGNDHERAERGEIDREHLHRLAERPIAEYPPG